MVSLGLVLEQYPDDVVVFITDPRTGVQRHLKWPPTISEVVEACDNRIAELKRADRFRNWGKNDESLQIEGPVVAKPTIDELKAKYGPTWGIDPTGGDMPKRPVTPAPTAEELTAHYAKYGLSFQMKDKGEMT